MFDLQHAKEVVQLLVENSFVRFGDNYFHQTQGTPMGINPAVFTANYYLFHYECKFVERLAGLIPRDSPQFAPGECPDNYVACALQMRTTAGLHAEGLWPYIPDVAWSVLRQFVYMVRYVDDLTSGPNRFLKSLLYTDQTLLAGMIHGIYPAHFLQLDPIPYGLCDFPTLDISIESCVVPCYDHRGGPAGDPVVHSYTRLYDKRSQACYAGIPIVRYTHVSSTLSMNSGYNILVSQLHRLRELTSVRGNYVLEAAK